MAYCTCTVLLFLCFLFVPLLYLWTIYFFYLGGQSVSCKASLAALRLYGYFCDYVVLLSENKYDDDDVAGQCCDDILLIESRDPNQIASVLSAFRLLSL